jgi:purine-nucleoside phosphorylase
VSYEEEADRMESNKPPHLTPRSLVGQRFASDVFGGIKVALVGYCPPPSALERYAPQRVEDQHFIHVSPDSVRILTHGGRRFLSLAHVYGGPVSSATVEELAYYGIEVILAYGLAGGLGTKGLKMGDFYMVEDAFAADGTTPHYSKQRVIAAERTLQEEVLALWPAWPRGTPMTTVRASTGDAIYREDDAMLEGFVREGCDIVNLDSAHLYAAALMNAEKKAMRAIQCGVISDVIALGPDEEAESTLSVMLAKGGEGGLNPLEMTGEIVRFYVERLAPALTS